MTLIAQRENEWVKEQLLCSDSPIRVVLSLRLISLFPISQTAFQQSQNLAYQCLCFSESSCLSAHPNHNPPPPTPRISLSAQG